MSIDRLPPADLASAKPAASRLRKILGDGRFAITAELVPPVGTQAHQVLEKAEPLRGLADAVNVTDGAGARAHMCPIAAAALLESADIETVLQITCRDRNRLALQSDLMGAAALRIRNLLVLRGDDPTAGDQPDTKPVFDLDSRSLTATIIGMRDRGELPSGRKLQGAADFFIGGADIPIDPPDGWVPETLAAKADAGTQFIQTQFCMDMGVARRYVARLAEHGLTERLHILVGIAPLASGRSARWMRDKLFGAIIPDSIIARIESAADARSEGRAICIELLQELTEIPGVSGAHIMAPLNEDAIPEVIAKSGLSNRN